MRPPTPAMIAALRKLEVSEFGTLECRPSTRQALVRHKMISFDRDTTFRWHITDAGRSVLAEQEKHP